MLYDYERKELEEICTVETDNDSSEDKWHVEPFLYFRVLLVTILNVIILKKKSHFKNTQ